MVDFPEPLGPTITASSPDSIRRSTPLSAVTSVLFPPLAGNFFVTSSKVMVVMGAPISRLVGVRTG
ncbi:hypothetical protein ACFQ0O_22125 [Saccharopolyspora spinosporotrichia]